VNIKKKKWNVLMIDKHIHNGSFKDLKLYICTQDASTTTNLSHVLTIYGSDCQLFTSHGPFILNFKKIITFVNSYV